MVNSNDSELTKKSCFSQGDCQKEMTKAEREVFMLLTTEFLSPTQISRRRKTSTGATSNLLRSLRKKGWLKSKLIAATQPNGIPSNAVNQSVKKYRLHAEELNVKIIQDSSKYHTLRQEKRTRTIDDNTVRLYKKSIEIYSGQSFWADTPDGVLAPSSIYWTRFLARAGDELGIIICKERSNNVKRVKGELAETGNELALDMNSREAKLKVFGEDGKLWLLIDNSWKLQELETVHPQKHVSDMAKVVKVFSDYRTHPETPVPSEMHHTQEFILEALKQTTILAQKNTQNLEYYAENIVTHVQVMQEISKYIKEFNELVRRKYL